MSVYLDKTITQKCTCTPVGLAALFIIVKTWIQPKCPPIDEWMKKMWYIYTTEYYSAIKANAFESVLMKWMNEPRTYYTK